MVMKMKQIVHNYDSLYEKDVNRIVKRAKALIINSKNEIAVCFSHDNYFFLGGHVDSNESDYECLKREILEEAGVSLEFNLNDILFSIIYYNKDYPEKGINTKSITNYYIIRTDLEVNEENLNLTESEKDGKFKIRFIHKDNIISILEKSLDSASRKVVVLDTLKVLKAYLSKNVFGMNLQNDPFVAIKEGRKTVEMRLYDEKRQMLTINDEIIFTNALTQEKIRTIVEELHLYSSFKELYEHFSKIEIGYKEDEVANYQDMEKYYSVNEQEKYGVVGIKIKHKY